jgi:ribonuclease HI
MSQSTLIINTDGGARGNPGPAAAAFTIRTNDGRSVAQGGIFLGTSTNNVAEYQGVILALRWLVKQSAVLADSTGQPIQFYLDAQLVVQQLNGVFKLKDTKLKILMAEIKELEKQIPVPIAYALVPREKNFTADSIVNQTLDRVVGRRQFVR